MNGSEASLFREVLTMSMEQYLGPYLEGHLAQRQCADARRHGLKGSTVRKRLGMGPACQADILIVNPALTLTRKQKPYF